MAEDTSEQKLQYERNEPLADRLNRMLQLEKENKVKGHISAQASRDIPHSDRHIDQDHNSDKQSGAPNSCADSKDRSSAPEHSVFSRQTENNPHSAINSDDNTEKDNSADIEATEDSNVYIEATEDSNVYIEATEDSNVDIEATEDSSVDTEATIDSNEDIEATEDSTEACNAENAVTVLSKEENKMDNKDDPCYENSEPKAEDEEGSKVNEDQAFHTDEGSPSGSEVEYESAEEGEEIQVDKQNLKELEETLTEEQKEERRNEAQRLKDEGNEFFRSGSYKTAIRTYSRALRTCPLKYAKDRAIMYSNRAACKMRLEDFEESIKDCSKALELHPHYLKALMRRAELYEKTEKLDEALADYQKIIELDPSQHSARAACMRLPDQIKERNEKLKQEMMGKLKDLGNMILRPFGLSTNNFQMNQDPNTGGYSINFVQNPST